MWFLIIIVQFFTLAAFSEEKSDLVDVNKDSSLAQYFEKVNAAKVTDQIEQEPLKTTKVADKAESEIPLTVKEKSGKKKSTLSPLSKMMISICGLLVIAGIAYFNMHKLGRGRAMGSSAKNIKILTKKPIGNKKELMLIQIAGETILLGVTDQNINHIRTLSLLEDELPDFIEPKFANQFKDKLNKIEKHDEQEEAASEIVDGYAVSRLSEVQDVINSRYSR